MIVILFDIHSWSTRGACPQGLSVEAFITQICIFIRSLLLQQDEVKVSVFLVTSEGATLLGSTVQRVDPGSVAPPRADICDLIISKVTKILESNDSIAYRESPAWSTAFLQGLCHARRVTRLASEEDILHMDMERAPSTEPCRILAIVTNFHQSSKRYLSFMNAFFSAQQDKILIDCCNLERERTSSCETLFQQGCQLTGGFYLKPGFPESLLQYLMTAFIADPPARNCLRYPSTSSMDFRASCFCHQKLVEMGYVCSVCLSVFCEKMNVCLTCGSEFTP